MLNFVILGTARTDAVLPEIKVKDLFEKILSPRKTITAPQNQLTRIGYSCMQLMMVSDQKV